MAEYKKSPRKLLLTRIISDYLISIRIPTWKNYALRALILLISPDFLLAAVFLWYTPLETEESIIEAVSG